MVSSRRQRAETRGRRGEWLAATSLRLKGYRVLDKRFRTRVGEIDLVARKRDLIAFIEVKARPSLDEALESVSLRARHRIERAAQLWLDQKPRFRDFETRFDLIAVLPRRFPVHIRDAWRPDFATGHH